MIDVPNGNLEIGCKRVSPGRTITGTDVASFCMLAGNRLELHTNHTHRGLWQHYAAFVEPEVPKA